MVTFARIVDVGIRIGSASRSEASITKVGQSDARVAGAGVIEAARGAKLLGVAKGAGAVDGVVGAEGAGVKGSARRARVIDQAIRALVRGVARGARVFGLAK